jgi:hypothetical protein
MEYGTYLFKPNLHNPFESHGAFMAKSTTHQIEKHILFVFALAAVLTLGIGALHIAYTYAAGGTDAVTGTLVVNHYCSFTTNVDGSGITFAGAAGLNPASNTIGTVNTVAVTDTGNLGSNILVSGSNWNFASNSFNVANTIVSAAANALFTPSSAPGESNEIRLSGTSVDTLVNVNTLAANSVWFGVGVPAGQVPGTYTQTINVISSC